MNNAQHVSDRIFTLYKLDDKIHSLNINEKSKHHKVLDPYSSNIVTCEYTKITYAIRCIYV